MHILNDGIQSKPASNVLELVRYRVLGKPYSAWREIIASTGNSDTDFLICLRQMGIEIDKREDPMLYLTQDTQQMRLLAESGASNPTMLQILLTSKAFALTEAHAIEKIETILREQSREEEEEPQS